ncbi:30S ribosomal protein S7 [Nanoarchaeota archaeon]
MQVLAFNKWDTSGIQVRDPGLRKYINLNATIVPKTGARYAGNKFHKSRTFIVERLINKVMITGHRGKKHLMSSGHNTGKATKAYGIVYDALEMMEAKTKMNPIEVLVRAIENAAPREEIITVEYAGARYPKPVEVAPQRRVDFSLRQFAQGAYQKSFKKKTSMATSLANEIILAYEKNPQANAIAKRTELERQSDSSR